MSNNFLLKKSYMVIFFVSKMTFGQATSYLVVHYFIIILNIQQKYLRVQGIFLRAAILTLRVQLYST